MIIARILGATRAVGKSQGYLRLPIRDEIRNGVPFMITAWEPTPDELDRLNKGAKVELTVIGTKHPPVRIDVGVEP